MRASDRQLRFTAPSSQKARTRKPPTFVFTVTRFGDTSGSVTADWATSDGSAKAGRDYVPAAGQLQFAGGDTQQQITVSVYHDFETERAEDFVVSLVDVAGATVAQRRAIGTILCDDKHEPIEKWQTAIRINPDSAVAHFKRGIADIARPARMTKRLPTSVERSSWSQTLRRPISIAASSSQRQGSPAGLARFEQGHRAASAMRSAEQSRRYAQRSADGP